MTMRNFAPVITLILVSGALAGCAPKGDGGGAGGSGSGGAASGGRSGGSSGSTGGSTGNGAGGTTSGSGGSSVGSGGLGSGGTSTGGASATGGAPASGGTTGKDAGVDSTSGAGGSGKDGGVDSGAGGATPTGGASASGGASGTGGAGAGGATVVTGPMALNIRLSKVELTQATSVSLGPDTAGAPLAVSARNAKVLEKRIALVRAHFAVGTGWATRDIEAILYLSNGQALSVKKSVSANSNPNTLTSTFNWEFTAADVAAGLQGHVELHEVAGATGAGAAMVSPRFPAQGEIDLGIQAGTMEVKVVFVPLTVGGTTLAVTDADVKTVTDYMMGLYPAQTVSISVHAPYDPGFTTFGSAQEGPTFNLCPKIKVGADAAANLYHVMLVPGTKATVDWDGLANLTGPSANEYSQRCAIVVTAGSGTVGAKALTIAHEIGHVHGLDHAPCGGADSPDPGYPYAGGKIGVQGYNILKKILIDPTVGTDVMGYCDSTAWISDYFWNKLEARVRIQSTWKHSAPLTTRSLTGVFRSSDSTGRPDDMAAVDWIIVRGDLSLPDAQPSSTMFARALGDGVSAAPLAISLRTIRDSRGLRRVALPLVDGIKRYEITIGGTTQSIDLANIADASQ